MPAWQGAPEQSIYMCRHMTKKNAWKT